MVESIDNLGVRLASTSMNFRSIATRVTLTGHRCRGDHRIDLAMDRSRKAEAVAHLKASKVSLMAAQAVAIRVVAALELERLNLLSDH